MKFPRQTGRCLEKDKRRQAEEVEPREKKPERQLRVSSRLLYKQWREDE
jgi:hypothetical protein